MSYLIRAWRIDRYFGLHEFGVCLRMLIQHIAIVNLLPMRAGEAAFPALMKRYFQMPLHQSLPGLLWLRGLDAHALLLGAIVVVAVARRSPALMLAAIAWGALPLVALSICPRIQTYVRHRTPRVATLTRNMIAAVPCTPAAIAKDWLLTAGSWILKLAVFAWVIEIFMDESYGASFVGVALVRLPHSCRSAGSQDSEPTRRASWQPCGLLA